MLPALFLAASTAVATGLATIRYDVPPPNFAIPGAHGTRYLSDLRGKVVVINFWATWCHVCTEELDDFVRAQQMFGDRLAIVTISDELPNVAAGYLRARNIELPLVEDTSGAISRVYSVEKWPITLVLDPAGAVSYVSVGGLSWQELQDAIERAQASGSASTPEAGVLQ
ncbi:MAG: TlpA family protein disulfide reductase [Candidatus Eremiobacteraeota bacterium]|nr:TlpA family protein disulfide reductase [Candidatus Eremiobacteraeota bacterium]MBV8498789.1 TlpA family protein disulfide reductase [Candidatus Eremiobacteraeota bacterium]